MDTIPVAPAVPVVAPSPVADRRPRRRRDGRDHDGARDGASEEGVVSADVSASPEDSDERGETRDVHPEVKRDSEGHIDCYG